MARLTVADLHDMKREGKKIAAAVIYDVPMLRIFERAGVDVLSIGDSFASYLLDSSMDDVTLDDILVFARRVIPKAERAVMSVDVPIAVCEAGPSEVVKAARRIKDETGADMAKIDVPNADDGLIENLKAVMDSGLAAYGRVRYRPARAKSQGETAEHDQVLRLAHAVQEAGVSLIDLYEATPDVYADLAKSLRIPVIGGRWSPKEADGKIFIYPNMVGYRPDTIDATNGRSASRFIFDIIQPALDEVHAGTWQATP